MAKSTKVIVSERIQKVCDLLLSGYTPADIRRYATDSNWNVSRRQIERYIHEATQQYLSEVEEDRIKVLKKHIRERQMLFKTAVWSGNLKVALAALDSIAKLDGTAVDRKEINVSGNMNLGNVSDEDLEKMLKREIDQQGKDGSEPTK